MHRIDTLPLSVKSEVRAQVYRVLRNYATGGNHGPVLMKALFLIVADNLVEVAVIERPQFLGGSSTGGSKFARLIEGRQPQLFPNYGIPQTIATLIRQTFWELLLQGILAPATCKNPLEDQFTPSKYQDHWVCFESVMLTPYGVKILIDSENRIQVHDSEGYLANFWIEIPAPDTEMMRYLSESISVFRNGHLLACVVLLGIASERLIDVLGENLRRTLKDRGGDKWFNEKYKNKRTITDRFHAIDGKLMSEFGRELAQENLKDAFRGIVTLTFEQLRHARNEIAHPQGRDFTWNEVSGFLHNFVQYFKYVNQIIAFLEAQS